MKSKYSRADGLKDLIAGIILVIALLPVYSQAAELSGKIIDSDTQRPLVSVNILVIGSSVGGTSDKNGSFVLTGVFPDSEQIEFSHIGYQTLRLSAAEINRKNTIMLKPVSIIFKGVEITGEKKKYQTDLPGDILIIQQKNITESLPLNFGELLRSETAVQLESSAPGLQTISIRGCNPDQVVILYDGIPLKSTNEDVGDISWLDVNDIKEIQIIKGSNTAVYGEGGIGGVLNIESVTNSPYRLSLSGRFGNYNLRDSYLNIGHTFGRFSVRYSLSYKHAAFTGEDFSPNLVTESLYHNLGSSFDLGNGNQISLRGILMRRNLDEPNATNDTDEDRSIASLQYKGHLPDHSAFNLQGFYRGFRTINRIYVPTMAHLPQARVEIYRILDEISGIKIENGRTHGGLHLDLGFEDYFSCFAGRTLWDFTGSVGYDSMRYKQNLKRQSQGFYTVAKYHSETGMRLLPWMDWTWSLRWDQASTDRYYIKSALYPLAVKGSKTYRALNYKLGLEIGGKTDLATYNIFVNNGASSRFPTLYDLYLNDVTTSPIYQDSTIFPERAISSEIGLFFDKTIMNPSSSLKYISLKISRFKSNFTDKIYYLGFVYKLPVALNAKSAEISGWDLNLNAGLSEKLSMNLGALLLDISDEYLFPNKPDVKYHLELIYEILRLNVRVRGFYEGRQYAYSDWAGGITAFQNLSARTDADLFINYNIPLRKSDIRLAFSVLNLFAKTDQDLIYSYFDRMRVIQISFGVGIK